MERSGVEEQAVARLTADIDSVSLRNAVSEYLRGDASPASTLRALVVNSGLESARHVIDQVTYRAATISRAGDNLVRDRADELTQLFVETEAGCEDGTELIKRLETR